MGKRRSGPRLTTSRRPVDRISALFPGNARSADAARSRDAAELFAHLDREIRRPALQEWVRDYCRAMAMPKTYPVVRLTEDGIDWDTEPGPDDEIGYYMEPYHTDDCLAAAIATATQIPIQQVPDLNLNQQLLGGVDREEISRAGWARIEEFASERGMQMVFHDRVPVARRRWIGVIVPPPDSYTVGRSGLVPAGAFSDHCLVMCHDRLVFNPACKIRTPPGYEMPPYDPKQIRYGITFDQKEH